MPQDITSLIDMAPPWNRDMALELADLGRRYTCIPALFGSLLQTATDMAMELHTKSIITEEGKADYHRVQGGIVALKAEVDRLVTNMKGDGFALNEGEEDEEWAQIQRSEAPVVAARRVRPAPAKKPAAKKAAKKATKKSTRK